MRTRNLDEAIDAVSTVYCPHTIEVGGSARAVDVVLEVMQSASQPLVELSYAAPVTIDAGNFPQPFLMMHCAAGSAAAVQESERAEWHRGQTIPFSAGLDTQLWFDQKFIQKGIRLDADKLETLCARWLGRPLDQPLRFALSPFSQELERTWQRALAFLWSSEDGEFPLIGPARAAFDEFLLTLLLHHHPHNYSAEINDRVPTPVPGVVRRAERYMADNVETPMTVSDVAAHVGVSLRSLQAGFRQWRATTPNAHLRLVRLQRVREDLLHQDAETSVTAVAMRYGFAHLGRFSAHYQAAFGEPPSATLRRGRAARR